jgi:hypothetical protein
MLSVRIRRGQLHGNTYKKNYPALFAKSPLVALSLDDLANNLGTPIVSTRVNSTKVANEEE